MTVTAAKPTNIEALYAKAKADALKHGIICSGDTTKGQGSGFGFEGSYVVTDTSIIVTITKKPMLATKARVEKEVKKYISQTP